MIEGQVMATGPMAAGPPAGTPASSPADDRQAARPGSDLTPQPKLPYRERLPVGLMRRAQDPVPDPAAHTPPPTILQLQIARLLSERIAGPRPDGAETGMPERAVGTSAPGSPSDAGPRDPRRIEGATAAQDGSGQLPRFDPAPFAASPALHRVDQPA